MFSLFCAFVCCVTKKITVEEILDLETQSFQRSGADFEDYAEDVLSNFPEPSKESFIVTSWSVGNGAIPDYDGINVSQNVIFYRAPTYQEYVRLYTDTPTKEIRIVDKNGRKLKANRKYECRLQAECSCDGFKIEDVYGKAAITVYHKPGATIVCMPAFNKPIDTNNQRTDSN